MKQIISILVLALTAGCSHLALEKDPVRRLKVLIVDGQNNHAVWPKSTIMLKQYLEETGRFDVDVVRYDPVWRGDQHPRYLAMHNNDSAYLVDKPIADPNFSPNFNDYEVVVSNFGYNAATWTRDTQIAFEEYMRNGGGFVAVHSANNSFPEWSEYNKIVGVSGWGNRTEKHGPKLYFDQQGELVTDYSKGNAGAHGTKHEFQLVIRSEHPITRGMPKRWMHTKDECYENLRGPAQNMTILASALCAKSEKGFGRHEPMLMTVRYQHGRIFHTTLGHDDYSFESVGFITTFLRGTEWAATGEVTLPIPADFPTESLSSARAFKLK